MTKERETVGEMERRHLIGSDSSRYGEMTQLAKKLEIERDTLKAKVEGLEKKGRVRAIAVVGTAWK